MNPPHITECGHLYWASDSSRWSCNRDKGHLGNHQRSDRSGVWRRWFNDGDTRSANYSHVVDEEVAAVKATMKQTSVLLTLEELTAISYYMPAYTDDKDDVDNIVKNKIYKALKGML